MPVVVKEEAHLPRSIGLVRDKQVPQEDGAIEIDTITDHQLQLQARVVQCHMCYQCLLFIEYFTLPFRCVKPGKAPIHPDTRMGNIAGRMQCLANVRPVNIAQVVAFVKIEQETSVPDRDISRHCPDLFSVVE